MKKFITFLAILMAAMLSFAQIPQTMSYQAVVRDGDNALVVSKPVSIELSILRGSDEGDVVYAEKHDAATNANGLVSLELGNGEQISETAFSQIDWSAGPYFVKTVAEIDGKTVTGVTPMLTVPYAKFAEKAGNIPDLTDYAKKSDIPEGANLDGYVKTEELNDYAKSADVDNTYVKKAELPATLEDYAKTADVEQTYAKKDELPTEVDLSDYAKKSDLDGFATTAKMNDTLNVYAKSTEVSGNYVTKEEFENYVLSGGQADAVDLSVYAKSSDVNAALAELEGKIPAEQDLSGFATTAKLNDTLSVYAKSETVPTKVSDLENDANYITLSDVPAQDLSAYATKEELNALNIPSVEGLASETYVNEQVAAIEIPSVPTKVSDFENDANYITLSDVPATDLTDYAKSADVSATYVTKDEFETYVLSGGQADAVDLSVYAKSSDVTAALAELEGKIPAAQDLSAYATKEELNALNIPSVEGLASETYVNEQVAAIEIPTVPTKVSDLANDANYITLSDVPATNLSAYATKEELNALNIPSVEGLASETYVDEKVAAIQIPSVPTKVSDLENDANYITLSDVPATDLTGYATTAKMKDTLSVYPTTAKMNDTLDAYVLKSEIGSTNLDGYYSKAEVDALLSTLTAKINELTGVIDLYKNPKLSATEYYKKESDYIGVQSSVTQEGMSSVIERGFCYSTSPNPTIENQKVTCSGTTGSYSTQISYLIPGTTYYVRAYATNSMGTGYGSELTITTIAVAPVINAWEVNSSTSESITVTSGLKYGFTNITKFGFYYSTTANISTAISAGNWVDGEVTGDGYSFTATITGLMAGKEYTIWPYAVNNEGTAYQMNSARTANGRATVSSVTTTEVTGTTIALSSGITSYGGCDINYKGFCYSTNENFSFYNCVIINGNSFSGEITGLLPATTYYVRALVENCVGQSYSEPITVTTPTDLAIIADVTSSDITGVSFKVASEVTNSGGVEVTEKGFCYSTSQNPTVEDSHKTVDGDDFEATIAELANGTTYYVRAYAVNSIGTAYSEQISVLTLALATVADVTSSDITGVSFKVASEITDNGSAEVTEKGFCYSTTENPTIESSKKVVDGDDFETTIAGLANGTTYYVRAYATSYAGTAYSEQISVKTLQGVLNGKFSISANKQIYFSQGNLQYNNVQGTHVCADGTTKEGTWRFAEHQYDRIGSQNSNISATYDGWIDLFGWGTSGWNSGANEYQPYSTSDVNGNYYPGGSYSNNLTGSYANADWGVYNAISNGGNQAGMWRTLTSAEWKYLIKDRTDAVSKYGFATVNNMSGLVLLPDDWTLPSGVTFTGGGKYYSDNSYSAEDWAKMEANGAVFLPITGTRTGTNVKSLNSDGSYQSSSAYNDTHGYASYLGFSNGNGVGVGQNRTRHVGTAVRLVKDVE